MPENNLTHGGPAGTNPTPNAAAIENIKDLVERFSRNIDAYRAGKYNETLVRREFIDPMFASLGWDVDNRAGYAEALWSAGSSYRFHLSRSDGLADHRRQLPCHQAKPLPSAKTDHDKTLLQRQIAATDNQIDNLVYELYGFSDDEIGIVEGAE